MPFELTYNTIERVTECWQKVRQVKNYEQIIGKSLFKRFLVKCPESKVVFGFPANMELDASTFESKLFLSQATVCISMLDANLDMLGADMDIVNENLLKLSERHTKSEADLAIFNSLGEAVVETLEEVLGDGFRKEDREAWNETYQRFRTFMLKHAPHHHNHHHHHHGNHGGHHHHEGHHGHHGHHTNHDHKVKHHH